MPGANNFPNGLSLGADETHVVLLLDVALLTASSDRVPTSAAAKTYADSASAAAVAAHAALVFGEGLKVHGAELHGTELYNPTIGWDSTLGYSKNSLWLNELTSNFYLCADATPSMAVWKPLTTQGNTFNTANKLVQLDFVGRLPSVSGRLLTSMVKAQVGLGNVPNIDCTNAAHITSGVLDIARVPHAALERLYPVVDDAARFLLTTAQVQNGDTVEVLTPAPIRLFLVVDDTCLDSETGYVAYSAAVSWSVVTGKPDRVVELGNVTGTNDDVLQIKAGVVSTRSIAQLKTDLAYGTAASSAATDFATSLQGSNADAHASNTTTAHGMTIANVTLQGNSFNTASKLVQLSADLVPKLPAVDGSLLLNLPATGTIGGSTGSTDKAILRASGAGGVTLQNSLATIDDNGTVNIPAGQSYKVGGVALSSSGMTFDISYVGHGLGTGGYPRTLSPVVPIARIGTSYGKAKADTAANIEVVGVAIIATDANTLTIQQGGQLTRTAHGYTGPVLFVDPSTAGALTETTPIVAGQFIRPILKVLGTDTLEVVDYPAIQVASNSSYPKAITNAYLTAGVIAINHGLGQQVLHWSLSNDSGKACAPADITWTDANNCSVDLSTFGTPPDYITGTWNLLLSRGGFGGGAASSSEWTLVERYTVTGSAAASKTFSGLNGDVDGWYKIRAFLVPGNTNTAQSALAKPNSITSNFKNQWMGAFGATQDDGSGTISGFFFGYMENAGQLSVTETLIRAKTGTMRLALTNTMRNNYTNMNSGRNDVIWNDTSTNITSLLCDWGTNTFGVGTVIELWKAGA